VTVTKETSTKASSLSMIEKLTQRKRTTKPTFQKPWTKAYTLVLDLDETLVHYDKKK
jgi:predicted HAD superfamily phosphohydrolase YqeG